MARWRLDIQPVINFHDLAAFGASSPPAGREANVVSIKDVAHIVSITQ